MSLPIEHLPALYTAFRERWNDRDDRMLLMDQVVRGEWDEVGPDEESIENRSPNLVQVALEDTAEAASLVPTVRVIPSSGSDLSKNRAAAMERLAMSYLDVSQIEMLEIKSLLDLAAFGFFSWVCEFDEELGTPVIRWKDPRQCYPETGWQTMDSVRTALFARQVYLRQLPPEYRAKVANHMATEANTREVTYLDKEVTLIEHYTENEFQLGAMYASSVRATLSTMTWSPIELDVVPNGIGICPVVIGQRPTLDGEPRGQFDQVIQVMQAHIRLMGMVLDYADQAVYSDVWVKDLVGQMSYGGGAYIQLGPQGAIGRVPPAVSSMSVMNELDSLVNNVHLGGRWPKSRPGEIDQAIASAKFIEATAGMMNTVIRTMHLVMKRALEQALRVCFALDVEHGADRTVAGVLRNQQFLTERKRGDIDPKARLKVDYGIGLGRDPAQTMVLGIQGMQTGMFSKEYVQENFEGLTDVAGERQRIDVEQLRDMAFAQLLQGLQEKTIPSQALVDIAKARSSGKDIFVLFEEYISKPQQEQQAQMMPSGLGGPPMMPGADPNAMGGPPPPAAPAAGDLLSGLMGGGGPPGAPPGGGPPGPPQSIGRLSIPMGNGSFAGTQSGG
jgi:hypothetical protein